MGAINRIIYRCDNRFHTEPIKELTLDDTQSKYGVIVVDGNGTLFGLLQGNLRRILCELKIDLPNKHCRGGQSQRRFQRLRDEKVHAYLKRTAESAANHFISHDRPNIQGLILAGCADMKDGLQKHTAFDKRLKRIMLQSMDLAYGGRRGFAQVIEDCSEIIGDHEIMHEKRTLDEFFNRVAIDNGRYCFGTRETQFSLEMGAVEKLIVSEDLADLRCEFEDGTVDYCGNKEHSRDHDHEGDVVKSELLIKWYCDHYKSFGCELEIISDQLGAGRQFSLGFGGVGALLRWDVDFGCCITDNPTDEVAQDVEDDEATEQTCGDVDLFVEEYAF